MWGTLIGAGVAAIGTIVSGILANNAAKKTNQSNAQSVADTNIKNQQIQDTINQTNRDIQQSINNSNEAIVNKTNYANKQMNAENNATNARNISNTNETNKAIANATNKANAQNIADTNAANAANIAATNAANLQIAQDTNLANAEIYKGVNDTNIALNNATNETNRAIAEQNLGFQRENLEYQKALQQDIFAREDTAYQRTAYDMAKAGLNPLSMSGTNGAGSVVSTSALNNAYQAQSAQVQGYNAVGATMLPFQAQAAQNNPFQVIAAQAQSGHFSPSEKKAIQQIATKMEKFQAQMYSFDFLTSAFGQIEDGINQAITHGIQRDQLNEVKKNNSVDRIAKLANLPYTFDEKLGIPMPINTSNGDEVYNMNRLKSAKLEHEIRSFEHDNKYGLFNSSTDWERKITGIQYLIDTNRLQSVGNSLKNGLFDMFNDLQKMYNRSF